MNLFPLQIFPESGLSNSVIPPIYAGLLIAMALTETLGWPFISLMVPGYLAPILLIKPISGLVILIEAFISYLVIKLISDGMERLGMWTRFFGTDAFYALLLVSVLVKVSFEGFIVPVIGPRLNELLPRPIDFRNDLHGIGLVVVPLIANLLWRHGLRRSLVPGAFVTGATYLFTRYVLIPYTNYSVSSFELLYERIAIDFLESPKLYIILLVGAGFTTLNRVRFGWTTHGILIPSLLGIAWFTPIRVLTTFVEAGIILILGRMLLNSKWLGNRTIEGARKIVLLFSLGFILKLLIGFIVSSRYPGFKATDIYGFAYLLPTLIAIEMYPVGRFFKTIRLMVQTSFTAAFFGVSAGFLASLIIPQVLGSIRTPAAATSPIRERGDIYQKLLLERARIIPEEQVSNYDAVYSSELTSMQGVFKLVKQMVAQGSATEPELQQAASLLAAMGYQLVVFEDEHWARTYLIIHETGDSPGSLHGWGTYVFTLNPALDLIFEVPRPISESPTYPAALGLFLKLGSKGLFVSGCFSTSSLERTDVTTHRNNMFNTAHSVFADSDIYLVRSEKRVRSRLRIEKDPTGTMNPKIFESVIPGLDVKWRGTEGINILKTSARRGFATLKISTADAESLQSQPGDRAKPALRYEEGALLEWLLNQATESIIGDRAQEIRLPSLLELAYLDRFLFSRLARITVQKAVIAEQTIKELNDAAFALSLQLTVFKDNYAGELFLIVHRNPQGPFWGTYIFRTGGAASVIVEVPNPAVELNTDRIALQIFNQFKAASLHLSGISRRPDTDDFDVTDPMVLQTVFQLAHQAMQRENIEQKVAAVQVRGFLEDEEGILPQAVVSSGYEASDQAPGAAFNEQLRKVLEELGIAAVPFDSSKPLVRFGSHANAQMAYTESYNMGSFTTVWLSSKVRSRFPTPESTEQLKVLAASLDIPYETGSLFLVVHEQSPNPLDVTYEPIVTYLQGFAATANAEYLLRLCSWLKEQDLTLALFREKTTGEDYALIGQEGAGISIIVSMQAETDEVLVSSINEAGKAVRSFLLRRSRALVFQ